MGLKICEECKENVDEAKAFCPECGNPFVEEEKREGSSEFDDYAGTMNFSKSVYQMMLSEMELDTTQRPKKKAKTINTAKALNKNIAAGISPPQNPPIQVDVPNDKRAVKYKKRKDNNKIILLVIGGMILLVLLLVVLAIVLYFLR